MENPIDIIQSDIIIAKKILHDLQKPTYIKDRIEIENLINASIVILLESLKKLRN